MGDWLGMIIFLVEASDCGMDPAVPPVLAGPPEAGDVYSVAAPAPMQTDSELRLKFQDDTTLAECVNVKDKLIKHAHHGPWMLHEQSGKFLPPGSSLLQKRLEDLHNYTILHDMQLNKSKSHIMSYNFTKRFSFIPRLSIDGQELNVIHETKLLGVICSSSGKWNEHISSTIW